MSINIKAHDKQITDLKAEGNFAIPRIKGDHDFWTWLIVGPKGSGKSNIIISVLEQKLLNLYDNIFLISPTAGLDPKFKPLVEELENEPNQNGKHFYDSYSDSLIGEIMERLKKYNEKALSSGGKRSAEHPRNLLILDDCISDLPKATVRNSNFNRLMCNSRHLKTDMIITSQVFRLLNTTVRKNFNIITLFPCVVKSERKAYHEEIDVDEDLLDSLMDLVAGQEYGNLTINFMKRNNIKFFENFKPLIIKKVNK